VRRLVKNFSLFPRIVIKTVLEGQRPSKGIVFLSFKGRRVKGMRLINNLGKEAVSGVIPQSISYDL